ncbi:MAG: glycosyltransferase, partial [Actinomycetota bacterium]
YSDHVAETGEDFFELAGELGAEGMVAKRAESAWVSARSADWRKIKIVQEIDAVIGGFTAPRAGRSRFGGYPAAEAERAAGRSLPITVVPCGVDPDTFHPLDTAERAAAREHFGIPVDAELVVGVSRLVPRKGFDTAIRAVARMARTRPNLVLAIAGGGRDEGRLRRLADELDAPVRFLGRIPNADLPPLYACADVFTMLCRNRWGGLEQEGFGIVFVEAAACGVPQVAGNSGGAAEAVLDGETGYVIDEPESIQAVVDAVTTLLDDDALRARMAARSRQRALDEFAYDVLARRLGDTLEVDGGTLDS